MKEPQYLIKSDTSDHLAVHKGWVLQKLKRNNEHGENNNDVTLTSH